MVDYIVYGRSFLCENHLSAYGKVLKFSGGFCAHYTLKRNIYFEGKIKYIIDDVRLLE